MLEERVEAVAVQQRWENRCERIVDLDNIEATLNEAGDQCWELVSVVDQEGDSCAVFKRPQRLFSRRRELASETENGVFLRHSK